MIKELPHWRTEDEHGIVFPWYTRPCLEWLEKVILPSVRVFEYGCGQSSRWYVSRGCATYGVDTDLGWMFLPRQTHATELLIYASAINNYPEDFDIIVIDGEFRDWCTEWALPRLKKGGYLVIDNFEQASTDHLHWPKTRELTKNLPLTIYKEPGHIDWQTAVWRNV